MKNRASSLPFLLLAVCLTLLRAHADTMTIRVEACSGLRDVSWDTEDPLLVTALTDVLKGPRVSPPVRPLPNLGLRGFLITTSTKGQATVIRISMGLVVFKEGQKDVFVRCNPSLEKLLLRAARNTEMGDGLAEYEKAIQLTEAGTPVDQIQASQDALIWALSRQVYAGNRRVIDWSRRLVAQERPLYVMLAAIDAIRDFGDDSDIGLLEGLGKNSTDPTIRQSCKFAIQRLRQRLSGSGGH